LGQTIKGLIIPAGLRTYFLSRVSAMRRGPIEACSAASGWEAAWKIAAAPLAYCGRTCYKAGSGTISASELLTLASHDHYEEGTVTNPAR
jgi:hypothetical protein